MPDWIETDYAKRFFEIEKKIILSGLKQVIGPHFLQVGSAMAPGLMESCDLPFLVRTTRSFEQAAYGSSHKVLADGAFLPFASETFSNIVLPHVLEQHELAHQVLREAHRVLMPEGHILLTGFNPVSLLGAQRALARRPAMRGHYYSGRRVTEWLKVLGFDIVGSAIFQYAPLSRKEKQSRLYRAIEHIGDRWLPMLGGGYMLAAKKRVAGTTMVGKVKFKSTRRKLVTPATANQPSSRDTNCRAIAKQ